MSVATEFSNKLSLEEFLKLPETKPASEYIDGVIEQKPMPQGENSTLQTRLVIAINEVALPNKLAYALTELRCTFGGRSIVPDIAVFVWDRIPKTSKGKIVNKFEIYPDWIIEILSPEQSPNRIIRKIIFSIQQGTKLAWLIDSKDESVTIFYPNQLPEVKEGKENLTVLDVVKDWQLSVAEMFSWLQLD